jgi:hypothetical protein
LDATARYREPVPRAALVPEAPWIVTVRRTELERLSPGTLAFLEYRSPRDREIVLKMYGGCRLLGEQGPGTWNARFYTELHMTNDRDLWTDPWTGKLWTVEQILGFRPADFQETRARMAEKGFWPLYEGKHIEQFLVDIRPIERWVSLEAAERKYGRRPDGRPKVVFRDIASNTNERTCIAAVLPEGSCAGNTLASVLSDSVDPEVICTVLNAFVVDFGIRLRTAATHLNFTYMARVATPEAGVANTLPVVSTMAVAQQGPVHVGEVRAAWSSVWEANRAIAHAYGVDPEELQHILFTFPVLARKRPEFHAYLLARLAEWKEQADGTARPTVTYEPRPHTVRRVAEP